MDRRVVGWLFVAGQAVLLVALVLLPGHDDWPTPPWVSIVGQGAVIAGLAVIVVASLRLGRGVRSPSPLQP